MPRQPVVTNGFTVYSGPIMALRTYTKNEATNWPVPNYWDLIALCIIFGLIVLVAWGGAQMDRPYNVGQTITLSLNPSHLPMYAVRTVLRMFIALFCSLIFTFCIGTWAAKNKKAERIIIPIIDVLQSVPVLSFLAIGVPLFIALFKGSLMGPECAAIFAIFTSQVWNMVLSFYQSMSSIPKDLREATAIFQLSAWQRFWRLEIPYAMPGLLWNMMMSMSGSWFFVTACEAISIAHQTITLPGVGSYIALAITHADKAAIVYAIITMLIVIFLYDQCLFRPLVQWSEKFKFEEVLSERISRSWVVNLFQRTHVLRHFGTVFTTFFDSFVNIKPLNRHKKVSVIKKSDLHRKVTTAITNIIITALLIYAVYLIEQYLQHTVTWHDILKTLELGGITAIRVIVLIFLCSLIWVPVGVWIGFRPRVAATIQPIIQFLAAFPMNLLFPVVAMWIVKYKLNINIWVSPLMVLGTQWYILFNVIAGASTIPEELRLVTRNLGVKGLVRWKRLILPGIFPFFVTGAITAAGGAWNASIIAEAISWGNIKLTAAGLGAYITHFSRLGNFPQIALGTIMMCLFVLVINRIIWRPLYNLATERFRAE